MLVEGQPDLVLAFHHSIHERKVTRDMLNRARKAGMDVRVHSQEVVPI